MRIERLELSVVGPETRRYTWSRDLPEQYQSNTLLRVYTDEGVEGLGAIWNAASYDHERYTAEALRHLMPALIGRDPRDREQIRLDLRPRVFPQPPGALGLIDIALWDLAGHCQGLPLYKLLGGARDRIRSYASTPMFENVSEYLAVTEGLQEQGFGAVKFHTWCVPEDDLALARMARRRFPDLDLMLDAENNYDRASALRVARELEELGFFWFEAPLPDHDLAGYRELTALGGIPIVPSGNWVRDLSLFQECVATRTWTSARTDVMILDGITQAAEAMRISAAAGTNCELMSWGYTLPSAANLHVMLGNENCTFYEQPLPYDLFEYGMIDVVRTGPDGFVRAPEGPGLGLAVDWDAMEAKTIYRAVCDQRGVRTNSW